MISRLIIILTLLSAGLFPAFGQGPATSRDAHRSAAESEFKRAMQLESKGQPEEAWAAMAEAVRLAPSNSEFLAGREMLRQRIVSGYVDRGDHLADAGDNAAAAAQFRAAIAMDPQDEYLRQRLRDVSPLDNPERQRALQLLASVDQVDLEPAPGKKSIHVRGDTGALYTAIGNAFNVIVRFDQNFNPRNVRFDLDDVDFYTAAELAGRMTRTFWAPVSSHEMIVATDTPETRRQFERLSLRTFYLGNAASPTDVTDIVNVLRNVFEAKVINVEPSQNAITIKAKKETVEAAAEFIENVMDARPELVLDVQELEFDTDKTSQYGLLLPTSFEVFNVFSEINRVLGPDAQTIINQLKTTGTIDPSTIPAGDLANLQGSPLLSPFIFFGKGYGLTGISTPPISGQLSRTSSISANLEHATLRATDGEKVTFRVGDRFPILTGTFTNVAVTGQGAAVVGSTPQFQFVDLGLTLTMKPHYEQGGDVRVEFEFEIQGLGTASVNNIPELTSRSFKGTITAREGEPTVITGQISEQEQRSTSGYPGLGQLPVLQSIVNTNSNQRTHNQVLIVVTPHIIRKPFHDHGSSVWWNAGS